MCSLSRPSSPNQQELLLEDDDFRQCYGSLVGDFSDRGVPHALLCTHGDTMTPSLRSSLICLPDKLGCRDPKAVKAPESQIGPGGVQRPAPSTGGAAFSPPAGAGGGINAAKEKSGGKQRMPDIVRIVTNYIDGPGGQVQSGKGKHGELDQEGNDVQQDIHMLLVLLDALRQADYQVAQRTAGVRQAAMPQQSEQGCPIL